jgi:hypothetical protein
MASELLQTAWISFLYLGCKFILNFCKWCEGGSDFNLLHLEVQSFKYLFFTPTLNLGQMSGRNLQFF